MHSIVTFEDAWEAKHKIQAHHVGDPAVISVGIATANTQGPVSYWHSTEFCVIVRLEASIAMTTSIVHKIGEVGIVYERNIP